MSETGLASNHIELIDLLPQFAAGTLEPPLRRKMELHLQECAQCRADLALWRAVAGEITTANRQISPQAGLAEKVLTRAAVARKETPAAVFQRAILLLRAQAPLVHREIWPASAAVLAIGLALALLAGKAVVIQALAPLVAAACLAILYGSEQDPAAELALATVTSPRQILLARLVLVFGYNFALSLAASLCLIPGGLLPDGMLGNFILGWLGTMAFLSAAALLLSMWLGASNAISITYLAWLAHYLPPAIAGSPIFGDRALPAFFSTVEIYARFWTDPLLLLLLSLPLAGSAVWLASRSETSLHRMS